MLLTRPCHTPEFYTRTGLGVEAHIGRYDKLPDWEQHAPFVGGVHLPYAGLNLAAFDDEHRNDSIAMLKQALDEGCRYKIQHMVMHTVGIETAGEEIVGTYERLIDGIRDVAAYAATRGVTLCVENQVLHRPGNRTFGSFAAEWFRIQEDVDRENVLLTLDTSHASTSVAHYATAEERFARLWDFLAHPERIGRVHWSDSRLTNGEAKFHDMHLIPGEGDLPREFHQKIKALPVVKTLEQRRSEEDMEKGLAFIRSL